MVTTIENVLKFQEQVNAINFITNILLKYNIQSLDHLKLVVNNRTLGLEGIVYGFAGSHFWMQHNEYRFFIVTER